MNAIITGGSSGLGLEIAKQLREKSIDVILIGRSQEKLEAAKNQLYKIESNAAIECHAFDISDEQSVAAFYKTLQEQQAPIQYLFNVAGSFCFGKLEETTYKSIKETLDANLIGLMLMTAAGVRHMKKLAVPPQRIVSVLSTAALKGKKLESVYNAAKWGARGFLEAVRDEVGNTSIEVINIYPGGMQTPFWDNSTAGYPVDTFMKPEAVAKQITAIAAEHQLSVSDVTINRPKWQ